MKEPSFPFHSEKYYEGTRTMLPEERACYIDLMIYQHQNGFIPNDTKRMLMYCSGISEDVLQSTLKSKFVLNEHGWVNLRLDEILSDKRRFSETQSINGTVGQFWKKARKLLSKSDFNRLHDLFSEFSNTEIHEQLADIEITESGLAEILKQAPEEQVKESWKTSFNIYTTELKNAHAELLADTGFITEQERLNPNLDVRLSIEKAVTNYWMTDEGWKNKKKSRVKAINWKSTLTNALSIGANKVWKRNENNQTGDIRNNGQSVAANIKKVSI